MAELEQRLSSLEEEKEERERELQRTRELAKQAQAEREEMVQELKEKVCIYNI